MTRSLPARPDPKSDRKRAKALTRAHAAGEADALARIAEFHPRLRGLSAERIAAAPFKLSDAQLVVAREHGVESWPRLMALIAFLRADFGERVELFLEAAVGESPKRAHDLMARSPELPKASLLAACAAADEEAALAALARDPEAALSQQGPLGASPLWTLCWSNVGVGVLAVEGARVQIAKHLLRAGAAAGCSAERESSWGRHRFTAVYGAVNHERDALLKELLEAGADPNDGESLYHATEHPNVRCLELLLTHGAQPTAESNVLPRALDQAALAPVRALLEAGAVVSSDLDREDHAMLVRAADCGRTEAVRVMLELGFRLEAEGGDWQGTGLNHAAAAGHPETVKLFLARGADPEIENAFEGTALGALAWLSTHWNGNDVFSPGRSEAQRQRDLVACVDLLIAAGAEIGPNHLGNASPEVADALRRHGAGD